MNQNQSNIELRLKDGSVKIVESGKSIYEYAKDISGRLTKEATVALVDGKATDLRTELHKGCELEILTFEAENTIGKDAFRHTSAHILAMAVKRLYPSAKLGIGPAIERGFYYDFDVETPFKP